MASNTDQLTSLAQDSQFRQRVATLALLEAGAILAEAPATPNHNARCTYAISLLSNPGKAQGIADWLCSRTNVTSANTTYDFARRAVTTDATDAAIRSQINTDWNVLAGLIP
jgi:hypothetical protein